MSYQILPILIFVAAIFIALLLVIRRLPEVKNDSSFGVDKFQARHKLSEKGIPTESFSKVKHHAVFFLKKLWRYALEAKELAPTGSAVLKVKRLFSAKNKQNNRLVAEPKGVNEPIWSENEYLTLIKKDPRDLENYDRLGKYYLKERNFSDAKDIYSYLTSHSSGRADFWGHLGFAHLKLKNYAPAAEAYKKSLALDSSQPNRYYNLAQSYKGLGKTEEARQALNEALKMDPQNFKFLEFMQRINK